MQTSEAKKRLEDMLLQAGFDFGNPIPQLGWNVFKQFVCEPVECADDGVLFQCGIYSFTGEGMFTWNLTRQLSIDVDNEYDHMEQLSFDFRCPPTEELTGMETNLWAEDFDDLDAYFASVENLPEFQFSVQSSQNWVCRLDQWKI